MSKQVNIQMYNFVHESFPMSANMYGVNFLKQNY